MNKKIFFAFFMISLCFASVLFLFGCGNPTGGGSSGGSSFSYNKGTVSGHVYDCVGGTNTGVAGAIITASTTLSAITSLGNNIYSAPSGIITATTDVTGYYKLTGLPSGLIAITATNEGHEKQTIIANSSNVNFVVSNSISGDATICGTIEGVPSGATLESVIAVPCPYDDLAPDYTVPAFDATTMTYEVKNLPAGLTYVRARYQDGGGNRYYAYNKTTTSAGSTSYLTVSFEAGVTIDATGIYVPSGYTSDSIVAYVAKGNHILFNVYSRATLGGAHHYTMSGLPPLKSGDSYAVEIRSTNAASDAYRKFYYNISASSHIFDDSSTVLPSSLLVDPSDGVLTTSSSTIEWNSVSGANFYDLGVNNDWHLFIYSTAVSSIELPQWVKDIVSGSVPGSIITGIRARKYLSDPNLSFNEPDMGTNPCEFEIYDDNFWGVY